MLQFKKLIVHNFGSYNHAEVDLQSRGFCLVSGKNNYKKDNALSNGSGKSFLWSAICFTLTGETLGGLHSNLKNINIEENSCYTKIEFSYDNNYYDITRYIAPKSELKILKDGIDVSAKGIRDSEKRLAELLPDITKDLLASTILIGQGMPNKFSSFSPSGRKELLEKLTKSDFMIEDIKNRVGIRQADLSKKIREFEDSLIAHNTKRALVLESYNRDVSELQKAQRPDFDKELSELAKQEEALRKKLDDNQALRNEVDQQIEKLNAELIDQTEAKAKVSREEFAAYSTAHSQLVGEKSKTEAKIAALKQEIKKLKSITDICPTCGQRLPNIIKPDTSAQEAELTTNLTSLNDINTRLSTCETKHQQYITDINRQFDSALFDLKNKIASQRSIASTYKNDITNLTTQIEIVREKLVKWKNDKENWDKYLENLQASITHYQQAIEQLDELISTAEKAKTELNEHLAVVKKMDTLIRRDFRGYLLTNIISYIDNKAKDYCEVVFGTRELDVYLDGNSLDISYCKKMFDGLSGGEKQRVDLILQFAIRDMLSKYLNFNANIIVLDEITDFLDKQSCKAIMSLLEKELNTIESVFLISHHAEELELPIDSELHIVKNESGISEISA